jgi:hypothetical protein
MELQGSATYQPTHLSGGEYEGVNATHAYDDFMSQLGATGSFFLSCPPSPSLRSSIINRKQQRFLT